MRTEGRYLVQLEVDAFADRGCAFQSVDARALRLRVMSSDLLDLQRSNTMGVQDV